MLLLSSKKNSYHIITMKQAIIDNHNFIYYLFNVTAGALYALSLSTTLSYQFWNIVIWFEIIPASWIY